MDKLFNWISIAAGIIGGGVSYYLGGFDTLLQCLVILVVLDYLTGLLKGIYMKCLSSAEGFQGIVKKVLLFVVVSAANTIQLATGNGFPLRETVIMFFIANEGLSLLENAGKVLPVPEKLKAVLIQLRIRNEKNIQQEKGKDEYPWQ